MIGASLLVIVSIVFLLLFHDARQQERAARDQGIDLVRALSQAGYDALVTPPARLDVMAIVREGLNNDAFAYLTVSNLAGGVQREFVAPGVIVPEVGVADLSTSMIEERHVVNDASGTRFLEFHAPLLSGRQVAGFLRLGYREASVLQIGELPFFATMALTVFLLTPLFYFMLKVEVDPLKRANEQLGALLAKDGENSTATPSLALPDMAERFKSFADVARERIDDLEGQRDELQTSLKLAAYQRARTESLLQSLPEGVLVLDETGVVRFANERTATLLRVPLESIIGLRPAEWCERTDVVAFLARYEGRLVQGHHAETFDMTHSGTAQRWVAATALPLMSRSDRAQIYGTMVVFRDVTAEHLARQGSSEFVAQVAHELKTPINTIAMYSESLQGGEGDSAEFRIEAANVIHDEVERLSTLISDMLSITRLEIGAMNIERSRVKLHDLLKDAFDTVARGARGSDLSFRIEVPREISAVAADKNLLRIAINNLLTNAVKYNRPGGTVILTAEETDDSIRITVRDTGVGITPEDKERIFDKFYRSDRPEVRAKSGHGLGLSLAREIVQLHHGAMTVNSVIGQGSEFVMEFAKEKGLIRQAV